MVQLKRLIWILAVLGLVQAPASRSLAGETKVDVALALAIDCSFSVDSFEHRLQMEGFADALQSSDVLNAIQQGPHKQVALAIYQWSDVENQHIVQPWTIVSSAEDIARIADVLRQGRRDIAEGGTAISAALMFGAQLLDDAPQATRRVIDLATDGRNNLGQPTPIVRNQILAQGITINGLAIINEWPELAAYLEKQVVGGAWSFVEQASSYDDFGAAMRRKLLREIAGPGIT